MDAACVRRWLEVAAARIESERHYLTQLDAAIGDADHGTNMHRGFSAVLSRMDALDDASAGLGHGGGVTGQDRAGSGLGVGRV